MPRRKKARIGRPPTLRDPKALHVRLDGDLFDALERLAGREDLTLSDYLRRLVSRHVAARGRSLGKTPRHPPTGPRHGEK